MSRVSKKDSDHLLPVIAQRAIMNTKLSEAKLSGNHDLVKKCLSDLGAIDRWADRIIEKDIHDEQRREVMRM